MPPDLSSRTKPCRTPIGGHSFGDIPDHDRACSDHHIRPSRYSGTDERPCGNPAPVTYGDGRGDEIEGVFPMVVRSCAEKGPLGNAHMRTDFHPVETENENIVANPDMIADFQPPREGNIHPAADHHLPSHFRAEDAQHRHLHGGGQREPRGEQEAAHNPPQDFFPAGRSPVEFRIPKTGKIDHGQNFTIRKNPDPLATPPSLHRACIEPSFSSLNHSSTPCFAMSLREIVQDDNPRIRALQMANGVATDMAGSASDGIFAGRDDLG